MNRIFIERWAVTDQRLWQHLPDKCSHHPERKTVYNWTIAQTSHKHCLTDTICPPRPCAASAHSSTALSWGYPTPVFLRVVQTDPAAGSNTTMSLLPQRTVYLVPSTHSLPSSLHNIQSTWSNANFNDVCSTQYQLLHHLPRHHIASLHTPMHVTTVETKSSTDIP